MNDALAPITVRYESLIEQTQNVLAIIETSNDPEDIWKADRLLESYENLMRQTGLFKTEEIRAANEGKLRARWRLGRLLAGYERAPGDRTSSTGLTRLLERLETTKQTAMIAQRIGTLPDEAFDKTLASYRGTEYFVTFKELVRVARPYWYKVSRQRRHQTIQARAEAAGAPLGPFPLIYADPPWRFEIYSEKGLERTPDQHYPTLSDDEIKAFKVGELSVADVAHKDAALLLWCTSSNLHRALEVMAAWSFEFKTSAVWDKGVTGLGLVFRNQHEILLYGTRGNMPGPQYQPASVFRFPRGEHSAKPPEIRAEIERMYPDFDAASRLELFARDRAAGWLGYGYEA